MGRLIIAGEGVVELGPTFINFEEGRRWNSTVEGIVDLNTGYMTQPGGCTAPTPSRLTRTSGSSSRTTLAGCS